MPNGNSPQLQIPLMAENDTLKYLLNNDGFNAVDDAFNRILDVDMAAGNVALTATQFTRNITFRCINHGVARTLTVPSTVGSAPVVTVNRYFIVINDGTGDVTISGGAGVNQAVGAGSSALVVTDGTDVYLVSRFVAAREFREEGVNQVTDPAFVNFVGNGITAAASASGVDVTVSLPTVQDDGVNQSVDTTLINFTGPGVVVTPTGSTVAVNIPGVNVEDEGVNQVTAAAAINFIGAYVSVANNAGTADVTIGGPNVQEEGVTQQSAPTFINFIGAGVTAVASGNGVDITIATGAVDISDEGTPVVAAATDFDFVGSGVNVTSPSAGVATIEIEAKPVRPFRGAMVELTAAEAIPATTITAVPWDQVEYDNGGWWSGSNATRLTVPAGVTRVRVYGGADWSTNTTGETVLRISKNGAVVQGCPIQESETAGADYQSVASPVLSVVPGDYFELDVLAGVARDLAASGHTYFAIEAVSAAASTFETEGRPLGFAGWTPPGDIFTAINSGTPDSNAYDAVDDSWYIETVGPDGLGFATTTVGITGGSDFDVVFALRGRLPNDADAEIGVFYGNGTDQDRTVFLIDEAGQFRKDFYNTDTTFGSTNATNAVGRVYNDFPRSGVFYMRLTNTAGTTSMQFSNDGIEWVEIFSGTTTENTMTNVDQVGLFYNSTNVTAGEIVKLRCVGYDISGPQPEIITGLNAHFPVEETGTSRVAVAQDFRGNRTIYFKGSGAATYTINAGLTGTEPVVIVQDTLDQVTISAGAGVTLKGSSGLSTRTQYSHVVITPDKFNADHYYVSGDAA